MLENISSVYVLAVGLCCYALAKSLPTIYNILKIHYVKMSVDGPKGHWLIGQSKILTFDDRGLNTTVKRIAQFPKVQRIVWMNTLIESISLYWPSSLQTILNSDCPKDEIWYDLILKPWLGDGLLISKGRKWKRNRRLLTPAFHYEILQGYVDIFNDCSSVLIDKWKNTEAIAVFHHVSLLTLDVMLQTSMSFKTNCQLKGNQIEYVKAVYSLSSLVTKRFENPMNLFDFLYYRTANGKSFKAAIGVAHSHSTEIIRRRRENLRNEQDLEEVKKKRRLDFLDILLLSKDSDGKGLTDQEVRDEVDTFLFEGHDTTASGISWLLYNLAVHQKHQDKCREEVAKVLGGMNFVTANDVPKFEYLTMCLKESMRLHSTVPVISRKVDKPLTFAKDFGPGQHTKTTYTGPDASLTLPVGSRVEMHIYALHHNPNVWNDPEKFDPSRFTKEEIAKRSPYSYIPFSAGNRNCIGQNFAMMEMKIAIAKIIQSYKLTVDESYDKPIMMPELVLRAKNDIHLKLTPVHN